MVAVSLLSLGGVTAWCSLQRKFVFWGPDSEKGAKRPLERVTKMFDGSFCGLPVKTPSHFENWQLDVSASKNER
jgi:hypothetical protein